MDSARPLRDVFAELAGHAGDPGELLRAAGHALPGDLIAEAVVSYADTAPVEVAEHLAPWVTAHSAVGPDQPADVPEWGDLLATAPADAFDDPAPAQPHDDAALAPDPADLPADDAFDADDPGGFGADPAASLDFGTGAAQPWPGTGKPGDGLAGSSHDGLAGSPDDGFDEPVGEDDLSSDTGHWAIATPDTPGARGFLDADGDPSDGLDDGLGAGGLDAGGLDDGGPGDGGRDGFGAGGADDGLGAGGAGDGGADDQPG